jgi:hypothetical protein
MSALARCACGHPLELLIGAQCVAERCPPGDGCGQLHSLRVAVDPLPKVPGWKQLLNEAFGEELDD